MAPVYVSVSRSEFSEPIIVATGGEKAYGNPRMVVRIYRRPLAPGRLRRMGKRRL